MKNIKKNKKVAILGVICISLMFLSICFTSVNQNAHAFTKPSEFSLRHNAGSVERDGEVSISWSVSQYVETYYLYASDSKITEENLENATFVKKFNYASLSTGLSFNEHDNGTHYYVMVAENELGTTMSNNINFDVAIPPVPLSFTLYLEGDVSGDGEFTLNWTESSYAEEYEIYRSEYKNFTDSKKVVSGLTDTNYTFGAYKFVNGSHYFRVKAKNPHGEVDSNVKEIVIDYEEKGALLDFTDPIFTIFFWLCVIIVFLLTYIWIQRFYEYPRIIVLKEDKYEEIPLGRFIQEYKAKYLPNYYILEFKGTKNINKYYSKHNIETLRQFILGTKYVINEYSGDIILQTVDVSDISWVNIPEIKRKEGWENTLRYVLYRIVNKILPNKKLVRNVYDLIEFEETGEFKEEIKVLSLRLLMKRITTVYDIDYEERVIDESGEHIEKKHREAVPIHFINDLERSKSVVADSVEKSNKREKVTKMDDLSEAINNQKSINEIRSIHELEMAYQLAKFNEITKQYTKLSDMYRQLKADQKIKLSEQIKQITEESTIDDDDLVQIISRVLELKRDGVDVSTTIREAYLEYLDKKDNRKNGALITENEKLKKELELTKAERDRLWETDQRENRKNNKIIIEDKLEQ